MKKQNVGGQAVIEGVMMQSKNYRAIAVRKSDGEIKLKKERIRRLFILDFLRKSILKTYKKNSFKKGERKQNDRRQKKEG